MRVCPEACSLFWAALSLACFCYSRCRLEQAWHRVSSGMGGAPHSIQMPRSLALSLLSWVLRRINSLRSGVWARWRSYSRRFSCLASSSARGVSPVWLPALLVSVLPVASASWVGAWPSVTSLLPVCSSCGGVLPCWLALAGRR